jgi:glucan 1,3-beta-glucosidase
MSSLDPYYPNEMGFNSDPGFTDCSTEDSKVDTCREAWALRIINSCNVYLYGGGFYSFFQGYSDRCAQKGEVCQDKLIDTSFSENIWLYSIFTVGASEVLSPQG